MKMIITCLLAIAMLGGCGIEAAIKQNDDRYMQPGVMDSQLTGIYNTYQFSLLDKHRVTYQWVNTSGCGVRGIEHENADKKDIHGRHFEGLRIYEDAGKTWSSAGLSKPYDFDRYVRSVKYISKERGREGEVMEIGFKALCFESWWVPSHFFRYKLHKRDLASWREIRTEKTPKGKWSERRVGANLWLVQEMAEQDFSPRPLNGVGGPFQIWLLPIGDTGYTIGMELGASQESLQYPDAHARLQAVFRHLIESVKIEPLTPTIEAEQEQLKAQADEVLRQDCIEMAKRTKPYTWCQKYLNR